jgi:hypothetical protein
MKPRHAAELTLGALLYLGIASLPTAGAVNTDTTDQDFAATNGMFGQEDEKTQASEQVPRYQIEKYVAVYIAMQRDHSLTVEQAAAAKGLTVAAFRELEQRIEHNEVARDEARRELAAGGQQTAPSRSGKSAPPPTSPP